jgi:hypothetical protein
VVDAGWGEIEFDQWPIRFAEKSRVLATLRRRAGSFFRNPTAKRTSVVFPPKQEPKQLEQLMDRT